MGTLEKTVQYGAPPPRQARDGGRGSEKNGRLEG